MALPEEFIIKHLPENKNYALLHESRIPSWDQFRLEDESKRRQEHAGTMLRLVNEERRKRGLGSVSEQSRLMTIAKKHSDFQARWVMCMIWTRTVPAMACRQAHA
jgi:uncharacterized protein YkwD